MESLFTNIPVPETIEYIIKETYQNNKLPKICNKLIFKRLLLKLTSGSLFSANGKFYKQVDGCAMGDSLSVTLSGIYMCKMEHEVVKPMNPSLYRRYVDDIFYRRKKNAKDTLFENINNHHQNIKITIETEPSKFLDTSLIKYDDNYKKALYRKDRKVPIHWQSKTPKNYKRNAILTELHRAKRISDNYTEEINISKTKYVKAGFPNKFVESVIRQCNTEKDEKIIPDYLFEERRFITIEIPYCYRNEKASKRFISKLEEFTQFDFRFRIIWKTRKIKSLFPLKDKITHPSNVIYKGKCTCGKTYIGETKRNVETRWSEHNVPSEKSEPSKHLTKNVEHFFTWDIMCYASKNNNKRRILESYLISINCPRLNEQLECKKCHLFRNGIT